MAMPEITSQTNSSSHNPLMHAAIIYALFNYARTMPQLKMRQIA
jgi:hypothetical protein